MGMSIQIYGKVWLPEEKKITIEVENKKIWIPDNLDKLCYLIFELGTFYGYELGDYLLRGLSDGFSGPAFYVCSDDIDKFMDDVESDLERLDAELANDLKEVIKLFKTATDEGYEEFEVSLWC